MDMINGPDTPKVSVIVAVFNSEKYLNNTIDSLLAQTLKEVEFIFVDDGSTDESIEILKAYEIEDSRIHVLINHEESDGAAMARNIGVAYAHGRYLSILDADDFFEPEMLEKAYEKAEESNAEVVIFDGYRYDDLNGIDLERNSILCRDRLPKGIDVFSPEENAPELFMMTLGAAWNILVKREQVVENNIEFRSFHHADDFEFVFLNFALAERIAVLRERLIHYRVNHTGSQASRISEWPDAAWQSMQSFKNSLIERGLYEKYRDAFVRKAMHYFRFYLDNLSNAGSFRKLYDALKEGQLRKLDIADASNEMIGDISLAEIRDLIISASAEEYLFRKLNKKTPFDRAVSWKDRIPKKSRIILYGADRMGVDVFYAIMWERDYAIAAWVDNQYEDMGYPIMPIESIVKCDYDYILVTNVSETVYRKALQDVAGLGIETDKVKWIIS